MNCQQATRYIWDYCDNKLSPDLGAAVENHCRECQQCNRHLQLTVLENEALKNTAQLPELSPGFTARVMKNLPTKDFAAGNKKGSIRSRSFSSRRRWMTASSVILGIILVLLVLPGIRPDGILDFTKKSVISPTPGQLGTLGQIEAPKSDINITIVPVNSEENQSSGDASAVEEKKVLTSTENTSYDIAPAPAPTSHSEQPVESNSSVSRGTNANNNSNNLAVAEAPYQVSLPGTYTLLNITSNNDNSMSYQFGQDKTDVVVDVIVSKVEDKKSDDSLQTPSLSTVPDNSQSTSKSSRESSSNSEISWTILSGDTSYRLTLNGNLSPQELALLASSIDFDLK